MSAKLTRRAILGTVIGGLAVAPFAVWSLRHPKQLELGQDSEFVKFRQRFEPRVEFPRTYDGQPNPKLSAEKAEKVLNIHRRYWANFSCIDEVEFDYLSRTVVDGKLMPNVWSMDAHVRVKYGYGMDAKGTDANGKPVHLYFNMDGDVAPVGREESDLSSMMLAFFGSYNARPEMVGGFIDIEEGVELPKNPYIKGDGLYDALSFVIEREPALRYGVSYFSKKTGMLELGVRPRDGKSNEVSYEVRAYIPVSGIVMPTRNDSYSKQGNTRISERYRNIEVKLVS